MNWLNLNITVLDSEEFLGAEPVQRATWLCLLRYCIGQENGGRIKGAKAWTDRKWQQVVRVTGEEAVSTCDLWRWDGEDLVVSFYPVEKETEVQINRANGSKGGRPRKAIQEAKPKPEPIVEPTHNHPVSDGITGRFGIAETEGKGIGIGSGKEGEGNRNGNEATSPAPASASRVEPIVDACVQHAQQHHPTNPDFAASVGRQFHALFARKNWRTKSGEDLLLGAAWKYRLNQMVEEEARKDLAKPPYARAGAGATTTRTEGRGW